MTKIVAIHQPNFFPWLGYFDKIARSDVFVFLDHVQFPKTGGFWGNRVKMLIAKESRWVTAPIKRDFHGTAIVNGVEWDDNQPWRMKYRKTLILNYGRTPFYNETIEMLAPLIELPISNLSHFNMQVIKTIAEYVGIRHQHFIASSQLHVQGSATEMLKEIAEKVNCSAYMCGGGAMGYQDNSVFERSGIDLLYQNFKHPTYKQAGVEKFIGGLSIIDALMNIGRDGVSKLMEGKS